MPKIVVYTPTHHNKFILEAYNSLKNQTIDNWTWLLVPNGSSSIPDVIKSDKRVVTINWPVGLENIFETNIGALKNFACAQAIQNGFGDILVELDHDDILLPNCLEEILKAITEDPESGFLYSDTIGFTESGESRIYSKKYGWEEYTKVVDGKLWKVMKTFPINARSLCEIFYSPNHVRCWTVDAYKRSGGYDPRRKVIDDHDLICRTYLAGVKFKYLGDALYMQRAHSNSMSVKLNSLIQTEQANVRNKFLLPLVKEWCKREGLQMFDLGGAHALESGFKSVDLYNSDIIHDVTKGPWADENSVGAIRCADFIEHIPIPDIIPFVNNVYKQLAPGGWWLTSTPSTDGRGAFCDPTHVSFWNELSFRYYCDKNFSKYIPAMTARFQQVRLETIKSTKWHVDNNVPYVICDMCALKGQRQPGDCHI